jgi:teichoic acid transport system ATP-binding protein
LGSGLISLRKNSEFYQISKSLHRSGDGSATILYWFVAVNGVYEPVSTIEFGDICSIVIEFKCNKSNLSPNAGFYFSNEKGLEIAGSAINHEDVFIHHLSENDRLRVEFRFLVTLRPGVYFLNLGVSEHRDDNVTAYDRYYSLTEIHVLGKKIVMGHCSLMPKIEVKKI